MAPKAKEEAKAAAKTKAEERAAEKAAGITNDLRKEMNKDQVTCTLCESTKLGPTSCRCKGGGTKPGAGYDTTPVLLAAAKQREASAKEAKRLEKSAQQASVAADRAKKKDARNAGEGTVEDPSVTLQGAGDDILVRATFPMGKLGFSIERNAVTSVTEGSEASSQGVKPGWVIEELNDELVPTDKKCKEKIMKLAKEAMKKGPLVFGFRAPMTEGFHHCVVCGKYRDVSEFEESQLRQGPGKQMCYSCEEFADMGW